MWHVLFESSCSVLFLQGCLLVFYFLLSFTMSFSSGDNGSTLDCVMTQGPGLASEFCGGWEGWLEGAPLAQLASDREDAARVAVLGMARNDFLVEAEEGDFPCTGLWHCNGWVDDYSWYYYFGCLVYMDPIDERFFNSLVFFSAHMGEGSRIVYDDQAGMHCYWLDAGDWWILFCKFLLLEVPIKQSMEGFLGWVRGVVADLLDWFVDVWSSTVDGGGSHPQVMHFASVLMRFLLVCGGSGVFPLHLADRYWPYYRSPAGVQYDAGLAERLHCCFLSYILWACNYLRLMWMVGRESVSHLGYERWPLASLVPFHEVWHWVVSEGSQLDFLMHSVINVPYGVVHTPSS
jgi:hypothetical protein